MDAACGQRRHTSLFMDTGITDQRKISDDHDGVPRFFFHYFLAVVPDAAVEGLPVLTDCVAYELVQEDYDWQAIRQELSYEYLRPSICCILRPRI